MDNEQEREEERKGIPQTHNAAFPTFTIKQLDSSFGDNN